MSKYSPNKFIAALEQKINGHAFPACPSGGAQQVTTTQRIATILIAADTKNINLGPNIPAGMVICEKCGHIEFFAMGPLGLLNTEDHDGAGK